MGTSLQDLLEPGEPLVLGRGYGFAEGPAADADGRVYFSDGRNDSIYRWQEGRRPELFVSDSTDANGMIFNARGELLVCEGAEGRVVAFDVNTKTKRVVCDGFEGRRFNEPNDLAADESGGFYFSDPNYAHRRQPTVRKEDVYYCDAAAAVSRVSSVCNKPNGVLLSTDGGTLYLADARGACVYKYDVAAPGKLTNARKWIAGLDGNPDGMTLDEHENLYVCLGKAGLRAFDREGRPIGMIKLHAANCCFGGGDFRTLCVASIDRFIGLRTRVVGQLPLPRRVKK
jgi:gluconolactonase